MLHAEIVTHFVGNCCCYDSNDFAVIHWHATGKLKGANRPLESFSNNTSIKGLASQQLSVVIRMFLHQSLLAIVEETPQSFIAITWQVGEILLRPNDDAEQCDKDIERIVELWRREQNETVNIWLIFIINRLLPHRIYDVCDVFAMLMNLCVVLVERFEHLVVNDQH
jgi:hypothetical protein